MSSASTANRWRRYRSTPGPGCHSKSHPHMRQGEVAHRYNPHPLLLVRVGSHARSRIRSGHAVFDLRLEPGQVDVFSAGFRMDHGWWDCTPGEVLAIDIDPERARTYLHDDAVAVDPPTRLSVRDPILERLSTCMRSEVEGAARPEGSSPTAFRWRCLRAFAPAMASRRRRRGRRASCRPGSFMQRSTSSTRTSARISPSRHSPSMPR